MPRIPDNVLERLKTEISIVRLIEASGVKLKKQGKNYMGLCPLHDDKNPSLSVSPEKNVWNCLGACNTGGTTIDWVKESQGVSFHHAAEILQSDHLSFTTGNTPVKPVKHSTTTKLPNIMDPSLDDQKLLLRVVEFYHKTLLNSQDATDYLKKRGLYHKEMITTFRLGYANRTLSYRLPKSNRKEGAELRGKLQTLGLMRPSGHEFFNGSLVIPVINEQGLTGQKEAILCEALLDALTFWAAGYRNVTTCYGVADFGQPLMTVFTKNGIKRVLIAFDNDEAGNKAAMKAAEQLQAIGIDCYRIRFPNNMDANEYAVSTTPAENSLGLAIRSAQWMGQGKPDPDVAQEPFSSLVARSCSDQTTEVHNRTDTTTTTPQNQKEPDQERAIKEKRPEPEQETAQRIPAPPGEELPVTIKHIGKVEELHLMMGSRHYRVRGLENNKHLNQLKINLMVEAQSPSGQAVHVDILDLYQSRLRAAYTKQAAMELGIKEGVIKQDLARLMLRLETFVNERLTVQESKNKAPDYVMTPEDKEEAIAFLKSPGLLAQILKDYDTCGLVGETINKMVGYLSAVSRKLDKPLAILVQSTSSAGKSALMDAVLAFVPKEDKVCYSAMTGQSLYYLGENNIKHKILAIAEEEGIRQASYALKLLQSEGELSIASTTKNEATSQLETQEYTVEGPVMLFLTSAAPDIDEELQNRCLILTVNEDREQTEAIHQLQRESFTLSGWQKDVEKKRVMNKHQNAQRLLRPVMVNNPYALYLTFLSDKTRTRRDHIKYLTLINSITLLHQYQRPVKQGLYQGEQRDYIDVTLEDIEQGNYLAHEVLGRSLDELQPQTRNLLKQIQTYVTSQCQAQEILQRDCRFTRRLLRSHTHWGDTQLKIHLKRLVDLEYLMVHSLAKGQAWQYELLYDGENEETLHLSGLLNVEELRQLAAQVND